MTDSLVETEPGSVYQKSVEDVVWGVDASEWLRGEQVPTDCASELLLEDTSSPLALDDAPFVEGKVIHQRVRAGKLEGDKVYVLLVAFTPSGTTNRLEAVLRIRCTPRF